MNTLPNVTMMMEKYKSREGDIEISNQSGKGLKTWEWYDIQKWENGEWRNGAINQYFPPLAAQVIHIPAIFW